MKRTGIQNIFPQSLGKFLLLTGISIAFNYGLPPVFKNLWFILLIILYLRSDDEPFWLAFFLILNDGFAGFFGIRSANIDSIGIIPEFEIAHLYVMAAIYKVSVKGRKLKEFYSDFLVIIIVYIFVLFVYGLSQGFPDDYNILLRNVRNIFPLFMIWLMPRLLENSESYNRFFLFVFLISIVAFATQLLSIISGQSPMALLGLVEGSSDILSEEQPWRYFYNVSANLLSFFAALFYLSSRKQVFNRIFLQFVLASIIGTVFLSATRGWILGFGFSLLLFFLFVQRINFRSIIVFGIVIFAMLQVILLSPRVNLQLRASLKRVQTVESVTEGDLTAGGTSSRTTEQSPRVLAVWIQKPIFGWGFSDHYYKNQNGHVGNENILLHSGIVGAAIMLLFFIFFHFKMYSLRSLPRKKNPYHHSVIVFPIFFTGWFIIHSTSGQHFAYMGSYYLVFAQAVYFGFGAVLYRELKEISDKKNQFNGKESESDMDSSHLRPKLSQNPKMSII